MRVVGFEIGAGSSSVCVMPMRVRRALNLLMSSETVCFVNKIRRQGYQKTHLFFQTFTGAVNGSEDGDVDDWAKILCS